MTMPLPGMVLSGPVEASGGGCAVPIARGAVLAGASAVRRLPGSLPAAPDGSVRYPRKFSGRPMRERDRQLPGAQLASRRRVLTASGTRAAQHRHRQ